MAKKKKPGDKGYIPLRERGEDTNPDMWQALLAAVRAGRKKKKRRDGISDADMEAYNPVRAYMKGDDHWQLTPLQSKKVQGGKFSVRSKRDPKKIENPEAAAAALSRMKSGLNWKVDKAAYEEAATTTKRKPKLLKKAARARARRKK